MTDIQRKDNIAKEVLTVLKNMDTEVLNKIPNKFIDQLEKMATSSKLNVEIDSSKRLIEHDLSKESKDILSVLYYKYIANEEEKTRIFNIWKENEKSSSY